MRFSPGVERNDRIVFPQRRRFGEFVHRAADRQIGHIDPVQFLRVGMNMHKPLLGAVEFGTGITICCRFTQARAHCDDQIGLLDALDQLGVGAVAKITGINR